MADSFRQRYVRVALLAALGAASAPAFATNEAMMELLKVLRDNGTIKQDAYELIRNAAMADDEQRQAAVQKEVKTTVAAAAPQLAAAAAPAAAPAPAKPDPNDVKVTLNDGLKFKTQDGNFSAQVGMFLQSDSAVYWHDDKSRYSNGTELRRGRINVAGTVAHDWDYKFEADFAGTTQGGSTNTVRVTDAFIRYNGFKTFAVTTGNFKVPYSIEALTSDNYITFMERGLPFAMFSDRLPGAMVSTGGANWSAAGGVFGSPWTTQNAGNEGMTAAGRVSYAPIMSEDRLVHIGAAMQFRDPDTNASGADTLRFRSKPESDIISDPLADCSFVSVKSTGDCAMAKFGGRTGFGRSSGRLADTGNIDGGVNYALLGDFEMAAMYGPFSMQGEFNRTAIERDTGGALAFNSYYIYGSVFLTPDHRVYKGDRGVFDAVRPAAPFAFGGPGWGAWELGLRFSGLDLNDRNIRGGYLQELTGGVNWYPNRFLRISANYLHVLDIDEGPHDSENLEALQFRAQVVY